MKLAVIGGGGVRSMFLAKSLAQTAREIGLDEIVFMDNDEKKLHIYGRMARAVAARIDPTVRFTLTTDATEAVTQADYVITTLRVGQDEMRIQDEKIALRHNVLGQETTGAGGFSMALRSIPALIGYCELIEKYAKKDVKVFNFTNPAGLVSQALRDRGFSFTYGICDAPSGLLMGLAKLQNCDAEDFVTECYGLNHLSFFRSIRLNGEELVPRILADDRTYTQTDMRYFEKGLAQRMGLVLNEYLYYFFYREEAVANIHRAGETRGEVIQKTNQGMLAALEGLNPETELDTCIAVFEHWYGLREDAYMANETGTGNGREPFRFDPMAPDFGGYAGVAMKFIQAAQTGDTSEMILCVPNEGAIEGLLASDVVEVTCHIGREGARPKAIGQVDEISMELIRRVKVYERLAARAILNRDRALAVEALMLHPLVNSYSIATALVEETLQANRAYCGDWG